MLVISTFIRVNEELTRKISGKIEQNKFAASVQHCKNITRILFHDLGRIGLKGTGVIYIVSRNL